MKKYIILLSVTLLAALCIIPAAAQKNVQTDLGRPHGETDFVINWKQVYTYDECVKIFFDLQKKYPDLCSVQSLGKSRMGRDQYMLVITAKQTGKDTDKPALWMDGVIHGNELNAVTCCLYTAWYLLTRYDYDPKVHDIVNRLTIYSLPIFNVDAYDSYTRFPNTDSNPREPFRPVDDDGDGLYDEDMAEDVDGDGEISMMYVEDPSGAYRLSKDGKRFIRIEDGDWEGKRFTLVGVEGYDNDGDGLTAEDDLGGIDMNRGFPYDNNKPVNKTYPLSEPEARNVWNFQKDHRNIFMTFNYHNSGRWIMFTMPPKSMKPSTRVTGGPARGGRFATKDKYAFSVKHIVDPEYQHDLDVVTAMVSDGLYILKDYTAPEETWLNGEHPASLYHILGAYAFLMELWGQPTPYADTNGDGYVSDEEFAKWIELDLGGDGWIAPKEYNHPQLGKVWIGGTHKRHIDRNPPARYIEEEAMKNSLFVIHCLEEFPRPHFGNTKVTSLGDNLYQVDVEIVNDRMFPTISDRSLQLKRCTLDRIDASLSAGQIIEPVASDKEGSRAADGGGMGAMMGMMGGMGNRYAFGKETTPAGKTATFRTKAQSVQTFSYTVLTNNPAATLQLSFHSVMGGNDTIKIRLDGKK